VRVFQNASIVKKHAACNMKVDAAMNHESECTQSATGVSGNDVHSAFLPAAIVMLQLHGY